MMSHSARLPVAAAALAFSALCLVSAGPARAQQAAPNAISHPALKTIGQPSKPQMVPSLIVLNARGATLKDGKLVLSGVAPVSVLFADRPVRAAGHALTTHLLEEWAEGSDSFATTPPNATISVLSKAGDDVKDAVVTLKAPKLSGETLTFDVTVLEGALDGADGPASLFIDDVTEPMAPEGQQAQPQGQQPRPAASAARRTASHAAWYGSAWYGSATQYAPYYGYHGPTACGYAPFPPCD